MHDSRRNFLKKSLATASLGLLPQPLLAKLAIGSSVLTTVSDGHLVLPGDLIFQPMPQNELGPVLDEFGLSRDRLEPECNITLYQDGTITVLFDVGSGPDFMPSAGTLTNSLDQMGVSVDDVTHVVFTHAHPDHIWGLLDDFDDPVFPDAQYLMGRDEWNYWWDPETVNTIGEARVAFAVGAKRRMEVIEDQIVLFDGGQEFLPGIAAVSSPGHTPGHISFEISDGSNSALILGDAIGNHHVAFRNPEWASGSDQDPEMAVSSRKMLFDRIIAEKMPVVGFHLPDGGIGNVDIHEDSYVFVGASE